MTDRQIAQELVQQQSREHKASSEFLENVMDSVSDAIFAVDANGLVLKANKGASRLNGYTSEEMIGKHFTFFMDEAAHLQAQEYFRAVVQDRRTITDQEIEIRRKDNRRLIVNFSTSPLYERWGGKGAGWWQPMTLPSERNAARKLQESEQTLRQLIEALPQLIWSCRSDGYCDYLSKQWQDYTGMAESLDSDDGSRACIRRTGKLTKPFS